MKSLKKIYLFFCVAGILFLTGCGVNVSTDLNIDENFRGCRIISCSVSYSDILQYFQGDVSKIDHILESNCPDCLSYEKKETGSGVTFLFRLDFQSLEEYRTALGSLLNFNPEISFYGSNSIFSKGLKISENFSSIDMLRWFEVLLKEEYSISDDQLESLWETGKTSLTFGDHTYICDNDKIEISSIEYSGFDGIDIYTTEKDDRTYERLIRFKIPTETLDKHSKELEDFFASRVPENATAFWVPAKAGKNYELTIYANDFQALSDQTAQALDGKEHEAFATSTFSDYHFLHFNLERTEKLDFSYFLCTENGEVPVTYYYKPNSMTTVSVEMIQQKINNEFTGDADKNGFYCLFDSTCTTLNVGFLGEMTLPVTSYEINTTLKNKGTVDREILFYFQNCLKKEEINQLTSFFQKNNTTHLTMSIELNQKNGTLKILQTGNKDSLNYSSRLLFGADNNTTNYNCGHSIFALYQDTKLTEQFDLSNFLGESNKKVSGIYHFTLDSSETLKKFAVTSDQSDIAYQETSQNNCYTVSVKGCHFTVKYQGSLFYPLATITFLVLILLLCLVLWMLTKKNPAQTKKRNS